jgi:hypothetical protein
VGITGDLNGETQDFRVLQERLDARDWVDVGANAHWCDAPRCEWTCATHGALQPTRRDYLIANVELLSLIHSFSVDNSAGYPTHSVLRFALKPAALQHTQRRLEVPLSLFQASVEHFRKSLQLEEAPPDIIIAKNRKAWTKYLAELRGLQDDYLRPLLPTFDRLVDEKNSSEHWRLLCVHGGSGGREN